MLIILIRSLLGVHSAVATIVYHLNEKANGQTASQAW